jgi:hypothetical protein
MAKVFGELSVETMWKIELDDVVVWVKDVSIKKPVYVTAQAEEIEEQGASRQAKKLNRARLSQARRRRRTRGSIAGPRKRNCFYIQRSREHERDRGGINRSPGRSAFQAKNPSDSEKRNNQRGTKQIWQEQRDRTWCFDALARATRV